MEETTTQPAASEKLGLAYHLIPWKSIRRLSQVFIEGKQKYQDGAVNASNMEPAMNDPAWRLERYNHAMDHLARWMEGDRTEDHLAKVMWFCSIMIMVEIGHWNGRSKVSK